jgi:hypothetical protein
VTGALWTNFALTLALIGVLHGLGRELRLEVPSAWGALVVLSSPLLLGLSRTLYVEYALTVAVAGGLLLWLRYLRAPGGVNTVALGAVIGVGFALKMTFPVFLAGPAAGAVLARLLQGRVADAARIAGVVVTPVLVTLGVEAVVFPVSFAYYLSFGNTAVPVMRLIGPPEVATLASATYYFVELGRTLIGLLTPGLVGVAVAGLAHVRGLRPGDLVGPTATLWLALLGPLVLLALQPVKEPRHVAPCVVPAVLLILRGIGSIRDRRVRIGALASVVVLAAVQAGAVVTDAWPTPYYMTRALRWDRVSEVMLDASATPTQARLPDAVRALAWKYDQNVAIEGFPANEALAVAWQMFPGVVVDLDAIGGSGRGQDPPDDERSIPWRRFEDLYLLTAFDAYNRRIGWRHPLAPIGRSEAIAHADFLLVDSADEVDLARAYPDHALVRWIPRAGSTLYVLRARRPTTPYRELYARAFLARHPDLPAEERRVVAHERLMTALLAFDRRGAARILAAEPALGRAPFAGRNIYWIGGYDVLHGWARSRLDPPRRR